MRAELNLFRGREISTTGDGFLAVFDSPTRAVLCAAAMTRAATTLGLAIRIGIHTGEIVFVGRDARGLAVHAAACVLSVAGPGQVLVSSTTRDLLEGSGIEFVDAGTYELKGLSGPRTLARLVTA
jgi:class 3 adenylate cyclase